MTDDSTVVQPTELLKDARLLKIEPGDVLVLEVAQDLSLEDIEKVKRQWAEYVPPLPLTVVVASGSLGVLRPGEGRWREVIRQEIAAVIAQHDHPHSHETGYLA